MNVGSELVGKTGLFQEVADGGLVLEPLLGGWGSY